MRKDLKQEKAITLIALVITIIVLLILAEIAISMIAGNNSILRRAGEAQERTERGQVEEVIKIAYNSGVMEKTLRKAEIEDIMQEELEKTYGTGKVDVINAGDEYVIDIEGKGEYIITSTGTLEKGTTNDPVTNPHAKGEWVKAWIAKDGAWQEGTITSQNEEDLAGADIVAKLYTGTKTITPKDTRGNDITPGIEYYMYIEANGNKEMPALTNDNGSEGKAWQTGWKKYLHGDTNPEEGIITPYITEVYICEGVENISKQAFALTTSLNKVQISSTVKSIDSSAFGSSKLPKITIPGSVESIGTWSFAYCNNLKSVVIKEGVKNIGENAFSESGLTSVTIPKSITNWRSSFWRCHNLKKAVVKEGVEKIDIEAFSECENLEDVTIPNSATSIEEQAFWGCEHLKNVTIPNSVKTIGFSAFENCGLTKVKILSEDIEFGFLNVDTNCIIYVLNDTVKQKLINDGGVNENMIQVVTMEQMNQI